VILLFAVLKAVAVPPSCGCGAEANCALAVHYNFVSAVELKKLC